MKNVNIPKPCSEDWNEMTPSEKGAFCQKCALDVYDFTNKSGDEIRDILTLNTGSRVCGRIQPQQLAELNHDFSAWQINNKRSFQRAWVFTLFVVFGMTLFSCEEDDEPVLGKFQQKAKVILTADVDEDNRDSVTDTIDVKKVVDQQESASIEPISPDPYETEWLGEIVADYPEVTVPEVDSLAIINENKIQRVMMGAMVPTTHYTEYLQTITPTDCSEDTKMKALVFPNPAVNETTLKVHLPEKAKGNIELFALNGQKIKTIHSGRLQKGETNFKVDLTGLETGNYLVVIYVDGKKETVQFSKL